MVDDCVDHHMVEVAGAWDGVCDEPPRSHCQSPLVDAGRRREKERRKQKKKKSWMRNMMAVAQL
jgi:hypothetical protein